MDISPVVHYRKCPACQYLVPQLYVAKIADPESHCTGCGKVKIKNFLPCNQSGNVFKAKNPVRVD